MSLLGAALLLGAAAAQAPTPLFSADAPIRLTIRGPLGAIARAAETSTTSHGATLSIPGTTDVYPIRLSARGISRRKKETCQFPPLRVEFTQTPAATSLFAGQRRLKLVTHCRQSSGFQQYLLLEYAAYRLFNLLAPVGYRARLATIDYAEPDGRAGTTRFGFFIEDTDDAARRNGFAEARVGDRISPNQLNPRQAARAALFQYMIGNLDWSMRAGPQGEGCCHNFRLAADPAGPFFPMPYDFDYSGLVDAPYAVPPDQFRINSVRKRVYQGYCRHNGEALTAAADFRAKRPAIEALFGQIPGMEERTRRKALAYLGGFFADIATDDLARQRVLKGCVG